MSSVIIELNSDGIKALLQSQEVLNEVERLAQSRAGANEDIKPFIGFDRAKAFIYSDTKEHSDDRKDSN